MQKPQKSLLLLSMAFCGSAVVSNAAVIAVYNFATTDSYSPLASETDPNITLTDVTYNSVSGNHDSTDLSYSGNSGLAAWDATSVTPVVDGSPSGPDGRIWINDGGFSLGTNAGSTDYDNYATFTVDIAPGYQLDLNSMRADLGTRNRGASHMRITYVAGGTETNITPGGEYDVSVTNPQGNLGTGNFDFDRYTASENLSGNEALTGSVEFRIYGRGNQGSTAGPSINPSHNTYMDNLVVDGAVTVVPEPSTYAAVLGLLALAGVAYRRRRR